MKFTIFFFSFFLLNACESKEATSKVSETKAAVAVPATEEDCDEKAKQKVEIKEDSISLTNPEAGCSLDEAQK